MPRTADTPSLGLNSAFAEETRRGAVLAIALCALWSLALAVAAILDLYTQRGAPAFFRLPPQLLVSGVFIVVVTVPLYLAAARSKRPLQWCFVALLVDVIVLAEGKFFWFFPPAYAHVPLFMEVRYGDIITFMILLSIYALPLSRRFIAWGTAAVLLVWIGGIAHAFLAYKSATLYWWPLGKGMGDDGLKALMDPEALVPDYFLLQIVLLIAFAGFLALAIRQGRRFVSERVTAETGAALLGRFFPPSIAEHLLQANLVPARRSVTILFVRLAADRPANGMAALLADFSIFERAVFAQDGIVDRFNGGPVMASFGALADDKEAPAKALICARRLADTLGPELHMALHCGEAVCGEFGGSHSRLFSVVGDAVNVTRRILDVAQERGLRIAASAAFASSAGATRLSAQSLGEVYLRGRDTPVVLWDLSP